MLLPKHRMQLVQKLVAARAEPVLRGSLTLTFLASDSLGMVISSSFLVHLPRVAFHCSEYSMLHDLPISLIRSVLDDHLPR